MRVLHILNELRASGAEVMLVRAGPWWRAEGIETHILSTGATMGGYAHALESADFVLHHLPFAPTTQYLRTLHRFLRETPYDVIHVHAERAFFWISLTARIAGTDRLFRTVHNVFSFQGALRVERSIQRAVLRRLGVVFISVSTSVQRNERERFRNPTVHVRNWIDEASFVPPSPSDCDRARRRLGLEDGVIAIVTVGNCGPAKNHDVVIESLCRADADRTVYLHAGEEEVGCPERRLAATLGVAERCRFLGRVDDVRELLYAADVYAMPSQYEGLGIAALEAAATGLPCVLARVPGLVDLRDVLGHRAVWVVPEGYSVAEGLRAAAALGREAAGQHVSVLVGAEFGAERGAQETAQLYRGAQRHAVP